MTGSARDDEQPFDGLDPVFVQEAVESAGFLCDGRVLTLNSYENRVYQVGIEDADPVIAKFYRPGRWSMEQIREEHAFCLALEDAEIPVVAPLRCFGGESLAKFGRYPVAVFPRRGGHAPELDDPENLYLLGHQLGRIHAVGAANSYRYRPQLTLDSYGRDSARFLLDGFLPEELKPRYRAVTEELFTAMDALYADAGELRCIRVHGDCHVGNMLLRDGRIYMVDFDDSRMAPAVQDIWMLLSGDAANLPAQLAEILEGYTEFFDFDRRELRLIEVMRTLRMIYYAAWLARRWHDPAFPLAFPWFDSHAYWEQHLVDLAGQREALEQPPAV